MNWALWLDHAKPVVLHYTSEAGDMSKAGNGYTAPLVAAAKT